jgi:hypothetical protein
VSGALQAEDAGLGWEDLNTSITVSDSCRLLKSTHWLKTNKGDKAPVLYVVMGGGWSIAFTLIF